jgi:hypothetical protein
MVGGKRVATSAPAGTNRVIRLNDDGDGGSYYFLLVSKEDGIPYLSSRGCYRRRIIVIVV